ncbi:hypothetical protein [Deinococcus cavernae]|uniref:hypothetical protein n=1 Tax=Deinococcus cavernae TaxID=2320857 RepID=UPI0011C23E28|nr:hypothetical protein [Deinococcus cavernae]
MKLRIERFAGFVALLSATLVITALAHQPQSAARLTVESAPTDPAACAPPTFQPGYEAGPGSVTPLGEGYWFRSDSWIEAVVCAGGTLRITAEGQRAGQALPQLTVAMNEGVLAVLDFGERRTVEVTVPSAGRVYLGYFNDYYLTESRAVFLRELSLMGKGCSSFEQVKLRSGQGTQYTAPTGTALFSGGEPLTFTPCRSGTLRTLILGRVARGVPPAFEIRQGNQILYRGNVSKRWTELKLDIRQTPLTFTLLNPYWKTLGDRNLIVRDLQFRVTRPPQGAAP